MRFFYILHYESDAGHVAQEALHVPSGRKYSRTSYKGGEFSPWRRLDVNRKADGTLDERVYEAVRAQSADVAQRWRTAINLSFEGDVRGNVSFDGSENVKCSLTISALSRLSEIEKRLDALERPTPDPWS